MNYKQILISGFLLWLFSVIGTTLVAFTQQNTLELIAANEKKVLLRNLYALIPSDQMDNDIALDTLQISSSNLIGTDSDSIVYRARKLGEPVAVVFNTIAPGGYSGNIYLLIAVYEDGTLAGVRAVKHNETPGLGGRITESWFKDQFKGKILINNNVLNNFVLIPENETAKDNEINQITGATASSKALVDMIYKDVEKYNLKLRADL